MALGSALVDRGRIVSKEAAAARVQGRTKLVPTTSQWFKVRLFLPSPAEAPDQQGARRRQIKQPTVLINKKDLDGELVLLKAEDQLEINSAQLGQATWRVQGDPEPLRRRRLIIGWQAVLQRSVEPVRDTL